MIVFTRILALTKLVIQKFKITSMYKIIYILLLGASMSACAQHNTTETIPMHNSNKSNVEKFISNFDTYSMDIQAAGIAKIPEATLSKNGELYIAYAYQSGNEKRNGMMTLFQSENNRFEGKWNTQAGNGNSYKGTLYFVFDEDGEAIGHYMFGEGQYNISIKNN